MSDVKSWVSILLTFALSGAGGVVQAAEREYSVSGAVYFGDEPDKGLTDLWLATLSKQPSLKVLDRTEIKAILGELSLAGMSTDSARQVRLGRLLGVEYFAWIKTTDDQALLEIVEAATGRGGVVVPLRFAKGRFADILPDLAEQVVKGVSRPWTSSSQGAPSLVLSIPRSSASNSTEQATAERVVADLSVALASTGVTVLPRRFAAEAVQERWSQEKGFVEDISQERAFLGADYILGIAVDATHKIEFIMVETATGRRVGRKELPLDEAQTEAGLKALKEWGLDRLRPLLEHTLNHPPAKVSKGYAAPEILKSLYAGMVLHNQGRYLDAIPLFEDSKNRKMLNTFDETKAWINDCYCLAGFPEIAAEVVSDASLSIMGYKGPAPNVRSEPGIALLGVTVGSGLRRDAAERMGMLLIDGLYKASGVTVLASEDIAGLRDEYDLLLGLEKVKGTTWRQAPPIRARDAVTAHLEFEKNELQLRLCLIRDCNPTSIYDVVTSLPIDHAQWQSITFKAAKELLARGDRGSPLWSPPQLKVEEDQMQLVAHLEQWSPSHLRLQKEQLYHLSQLEKSLNPVIYLKALTRNPDLVQYRAAVPWRLGLARWFLRVLPEEHPERPTLEFSAASLPVGWRSRSTAGLQISRAEFLKIADKYPTQLVGLFARYNLALIDMTPTNFVATRDSIGRLIPKLNRLENASCDTTIESIRVMHTALGYALGLPDGKPNDVFLHGDLVTGPPFSYGNIHCNVPHNGDGDFPYGAFFQPRTMAHMRVDLEAGCLLRNQGSIPARFLREIIETRGPHAELTQYAVIKYFNAIKRHYDDPKAWPEEDLCIVYPVFADSLQSVLQRTPKPITEIGAHTAMESCFSQYKQPILTEAVKKAQQASQTAFPAPPSYEQCREAIKKSWEVGPLKDKTWLNFCTQMTSKKEVMEHYPPYLRRLHELYDNELKTPELCKLYCQFGLAFFKIGRYDLAAPLFEQLISWRDAQDRPPEEEVYVLSLYLLAFIKQHNGDTPAALRLAKTSLDYIDQHPQGQYRLIRYYCGRKAGAMGDTLKARTMAFIKQLRENPQQVFKNPYEG